MATMTKTLGPAPHVNTAPHYSFQLRRMALVGMVTMFTTLLLVAFLLPFGDMVFTSIKSGEQNKSDGGSVLPIAPVTYNWQGQDYPIYQVPLEGSTKALALVKAARAQSDFIDPSAPEKGTITWKGNWRTLQAVTKVAPHFENFADAWDQVNFPILFRNTFIIAFTGMVGTLISCTMVAYAFARFPIPGKNWMFLVLIGTIVLPTQVTLIPTYAFFAKIGWIGDRGWLPLIIPHFFANAYNVFLLRQYFMTLPRALDEAAMIDGAGPLRVLMSVIIPQSWPAIITVALFHFVFAWNDYFSPLIYLIGKENLYPISVGVQAFNTRYSAQPQLIQATSLIAMILPLILFFFAQRFFMRGIVITGVEK
jgi:multiple sugar transport system permease protein